MTAQNGDIRLRAIEYEDIEQLRKWRNEFKDNFRQFRYITRREQERWYDNMLRDTNCLHFAVDVWDMGWTLVGSANLSHIDWLNRHAESGLYIGAPEWRRRGIGMKAMIALHRIAFEELNMNTMRGEAFAFNPVLEFDKQFGLKEVGRYREAHFYKGRFYDTVLMDMTRDEWDALYGGQEE